MLKRARQPRGIPTGGEFANMPRDESGVDLEDVTSALKAIRENKRLVRQYDEQNFKELFSEMMSDMPEAARSAMESHEHVQIEVNKRSTFVYSKNDDDSIGTVIVSVSYAEDGGVISVTNRGKPTKLNREDSIVAAKAAERFAVQVNRKAADMVKNLGDDLYYEDVPHFGRTMNAWYSVEDDESLLGSDGEEKELTDEEMLRFARTHGDGWGSCLNMGELSD